ncbi:microsomal glutathione S-transferase 2-like [Babylonia areolata]|uniref:microsomal glutathione S-transferase 2-like n=1 Tax=Babylonia areolata TaxID=304850 RepID=UPI003FD12490
MASSKLTPVCDDYALPALVTFASLVQQARFTKRVGLARSKFQVPVPEVTGDQGFVRVFRAHQNSVEFFPLALSTLWLSSVYFNPVAASAAGAVYLIGRQRYFDGYEKDAQERMGGFRLSVNALLVLLAMSGAGVTAALLRRYADLDLPALLSDLAAKVVKRG